MARTALFRAVRRALIQSGAPFAPRALSRRAFLTSAAATAAAATAACASKPPPAPPAGPIAIIGGGLAGLTAAYRLAKANRPFALYEASNRTGGRALTRRDFNEDGQFCELGAELVDTKHVPLRTLADELGVGLDRLGTENSTAEDVYHVAGRVRMQRDMLDPATGRGAFAALGRRIAEDQAQLLDANEAWTAHARALDAISVADYLARFRNMTPAWALQVLDIAYHGECGLPTSEQSALNLIDFIGVDPADGFQVFGDSDEAFRIHGGSSSLPEALAARIGVTPAMEHALVALHPEPNGVRLVFSTPNGLAERVHEKVVLALPFTKLRQVAGIEALGLSETKLRAIRELGYGDNAKLMVSTTSRPWNTPGLFRAQAKGIFYSDICQIVWETSRAQAGARGVLTNFLASQQDRDAALALMHAGLEALSPDMGGCLDPARTAWMAWARQPFALGSYACARVGQYTTLLEEIAAPSSDGRIHFAGEHTSADFMGFMCGAVESGERVAAALLAA
ncbi:MAG: FAD-dependent oxidoreductase [Hyphomonadaceae bacterium]|nr:FAD-dependent oxidoreductase [Hyphomonadaceae bacterium]